MGNVVGNLFPCKDYGGGCRCEQCQTFVRSKMSEIAGMFKPCKDYANEQRCGCAQCKSYERSVFETGLQFFVGCENFNNDCDCWYCCVARNTQKAAQEAAES